MFFFLSLCVVLNLLESHQRKARAEKKAKATETATLCLYTTQSWDYLTHLNNSGATLAGGS